jgi:hypothetical protein
MFSVFLLLVLGFMLARQVLYHVSHTSISFCSGYFRDKASLFVLAGLTVIVLFYASHHSWDDRHMPTNISSFISS